MAGDFAAFIASLGQLQQKVEQGSAAALEAHVRDIGEVANAEGNVPYLTGALHDSQFIEGPLTGQGRSAMRIGYGTNYAGLVHEQPQSARRTGRSKWLESTITEKAADLGDQLRKAIG